MDLTEALAAIKAGKLDAQENPFSNTVTYGVHTFHRFHTETNHFYLSRPIFVHRPSFDGWPRPIQEELRAAVRDAVAFQRDLHVKEEEDAAAAIRKIGWRDRRADGGPAQGVRVSRQSDLLAKRGASSDETCWRSSIFELPIFDFDSLLSGDS